MKGDRLLAIVLLLQNHGKLSAQQLADKLEVSKRTILRDMEALSAAGIPVYADRGSSGGWSLLNGYTTDLTGMRKEELIALLFGGNTRHLQDIGYGQHYNQAFEKLLAASPESVRQGAEAVRQRIHIDGAGWHESTESFPYLELIQEAVWFDRKIRIDYHNSGVRIVEPLGLVVKQNSWYVAAASESGIRSYRISRIRKAELTGETFERPPSFDLAAYWDASMKEFVGNLPRYPALLRVQNRYMDTLTKKRYMRIIAEAPCENGMIEVQVEFNTLESACDIVLGCGANVEAVAPAPLRDLVKEKLVEALRLYE